MLVNHSTAFTPIVTRRAALVLHAEQQSLVSSLAGITNTTFHEFAHGFGSHDNMPYDVFLQDVYKLLENMEHGSARITSIVSDLKSYVRSDEEQELKAKQVGQVVEHVMTLVGKQVRKMVKRFDVEIADDLVPVQMNQGKIEQVLINLLINAGQAADKEDSWVQLSVRSAAGSKGWVEIQVEDNGAGVRKDKLEKIFEPF